LGAVAGAVLCGGSSRRMGTDKATLLVDGTPLAERVAAVLDAAGCGPTFFVGGDAARLGATGRTVVADRWPGEGPVGAIVTALAHAQSCGADAVVVAACDLVDLTPAAARSVATAPGDVVVADSGRVEPLLSRWSVDAAERLEALFASVRSAAAAAEALGAVDVAVDPAALRNANTPDDLRPRPPAASAAAGRHAHVRRPSPH